MRGIQSLPPDNRPYPWCRAQGELALGFKDEASLYDSSPQPYAELFVMNADGSNQRSLTDDQWEDGTPAWQPALAVK